MKIASHVLAGLAAGLTVAMLAGCGNGTHAAPTEKTARAQAPTEKTARALAPSEKTARALSPAEKTARALAPTEKTAAPARALLDPSGRAVLVEPANLIQLSSNAGQSWSMLRLPAAPASGQSIAIAGGAIAALTVDAHGMALQRTADSGRSWQARPVPLSMPTDQADLAVSPDGSRVAVLASVQGSANDGNTPELFTGSTGGALVAQTAPASGSIAWAGNRLLLAGGPLNSRLYSSDDNGASWVSRPVGGVIAARFNLDPNTPSIGTPLVSSAGSVLLPVTVHAGRSASVQFYRSSNANSFTASVRVPLTSQLGSGAMAVVSMAGPGRYLVAEPGSTALHLVTDSGQLTITPTGLPGPVDSLSFADAEHGLAQVTVRSCNGSKQSCASTVEVLRTSDGGHSWT
ncbi:MAG: hypothetical protein ABI418_08225, partial [Jatrophihabitantaceae bacterium]